MVTLASKLELLLRSCPPGGATVTGNGVKFSQPPAFFFSFLIAKTSNLNDGHVTERVIGRRRSGNDHQR